MLSSQTKTELDNQYINRLWTPEFVKDRRRGEGYIFLNGSRQIEFIVDGNDIRYGHVAILRTEGNDAPRFEDEKIKFCVDYVTDIGTQCATIPIIDDEIKYRFEQITKDKIFIVFQTRETNALINGIGTMRDGRTDNWLFWDVKSFGEI